MAGIVNSAAWKRLEAHVNDVKGVHLRDMLKMDERCAAMAVEHDGIVMDFARESMMPETIDMLFDLCETASVQEKKRAMCNAECINVTEGRPVLHCALRCAKDEKLMFQGHNVVEDVHAVLSHIESFSGSVRSGAWKGCTGKALKNIVSIGIGGSYLGPEFVYEALRMDPSCQAAAAGMTLRFLANVDPVDVARALDGLDPETTLVIVVSKTFTTAETMMNAKSVREWLWKHLEGKVQCKESIVRQHMVAVSTAIPLAEAFGISTDNIFGFWDWVGGRYSVTSAVGILPLALQYGYLSASKFLEGARAMDRHFFEAPVRSNLPVLLGLIGVWNASFLKHATRAVLPYSQALVRFAAHIQQLEMESNGKRVDIAGNVVHYPCGEVIFGEPGTNGQHSFYQLLHQGTTVVPAEFIGFSKSQTNTYNTQHASSAGSISNHDELMCNFFAQPDALACGKTEEELLKENVPAALRPHKIFPGNRPSLSLLLDSLTPYSCGQLLALYEHRVAVQGFIWDINSFDQWGVELGKVLAGKVRHTMSGVSSLSATPLESSAAVSAAQFNSSTSSLLQKYLSQRST